MKTSQDLTVTLIALVIFASLAAFSYHRHFRKHDSVKPRMVPWSIISLASVATCFMLFVHLVNLFGLETGGRI